MVGNGQATERWLDMPDNHMTAGLMIKPVTDLTKSFDGFPS